uniref:Uncharacterized protein n=1 Tax=Heliothis virescens TaxID=7102 RepID=A0A2A4JT18_HELVI
MSPRRRTLCFVVTLLSLNNGLVSVTSVDVGLASSLPTPALPNPYLSANRLLPDNLPGAPKIYPNPRLGLNNVSPYGSYPQGIAPNTVPTSYANPNVLTTYSTYVPHPEKSVPLPIVEQTSDAFLTPKIDTLTIVENSSPRTQTVQVDVNTNSFDFPSANGVNVYQTPSLARTPSTPLVLATPQVTNPCLAGGANRIFPETLPVTQRMFPNPRLGLNAFPCGSYQPDIAASTLPTSCCATPNVYTAYSSYVPPIENVISTHPLPIVEQIPDPYYTPDIESLTIVENSSPITQTVQVDVDTNSFDFPGANVANVYQAPVSAQLPATPLVLAAPQAANTFIAGGANRIYPNPSLGLNAFPYGTYQPDFTVSTIPTSCCATPNLYTAYSAYVPPVENAIYTNPLPIVEQIPDAVYTPEIESLTIVENSSPITQTVQVDIDTNTFDIPSANVVDIYQTPITVQAAPAPQVSPVISVAPPLPEILPVQNYVQEILPPTIEPCTSPIVAPATILPSYDVGYCQPYPITLQVSMPPPYISEPVIAIIPQTQPQPQPQNNPCPYPSFDPSFAMPPQPIIVMEKSNSNWKNILPILLLTLFDGCGNCGGGYGNCGGGGNSQCCTSTPIPFPVVIPETEVSAQGVYPFYGGGQLTYSNSNNDDDYGLLLAVLLLATRNRGNDCCGCCNCGGQNIPIPYPIPIPTNNPIITTSRNNNGGREDNDGDGDTVNVITENDSNVSAEAVASNELDNVNNNEASAQSVAQTNPSKSPATAGNSAQQGLTNNQNVGVNNAIGFQQQMQRTNTANNINQTPNGGFNINFPVQPNTQQGNFQQASCANLQGIIQPSLSLQANLQPQGAPGPVANVQFAKQGSVQLSPGLGPNQAKSQTCTTQLNTGCRQNQIPQQQNVAPISNVPTPVTQNAPYASNPLAELAALKGHPSLLSLFTGQNNAQPQQNQQMANFNSPQNQLSDVQKQFLVRALQSQTSGQNQPIVNYGGAQTQFTIGGADNRPTVTYQPSTVSQLQPQAVVAPITSQQPYITVQAQPLTTYLQNQQPQVIEEPSLMSLILSEFQPTESQYPAYPQYPVQKESKSNLKSLIPLIINLLKEKNCGCRNCGCPNNGCGGVNNMPEPTIFGGYTNQKNYSQGTVETPTTTTTKENKVEEVKSKNTKDRKKLKKNVVNVDSEEASDENDSEYEDESEEN